MTKPGFRSTHEHFVSRTRSKAFGLLATTSVLLGVAEAAPTAPGNSVQVFQDPAGYIATIKVDGPIDRSNAFFQSLGTNGRSCATCHDARQAMSFTPAAARARYDATRGKDPLFASFDGANCQDVNPGNRAGHSMVLKSGLIRVGITVPAAAEFSIAVVHDPNGCALKVDPASGLLEASVYRRPLPTANLGFLSAVMFDGRETAAPLNDGATFSTNLRTDLMHQALDATLGHAQAAQAPTDAQLNAIVDFELALTTAQLSDDRAGPLNIGGALGGPLQLSHQEYYPGINDSLGQEPTGAAFSPVAMQMFGAWAQPSRHIDNDRKRARADIAAGETIFNTFPLTIGNVRGLNDNAAIGSPTSFVGNCTSCHDTPNVGNHSLPLPLDIGTSHSALPSMESDPAIAAALRELEMPDLPVFLIQGCPNPFNPGQTASFYTSDPGKALLTGRCSDFNRLKGPILRGLAGRAPYFHNGAAADLGELVSFYNQRFTMGLTERQKRQLVAFLNSL
jgi:cytochrome c553